MNRREARKQEELKHLSSNGRSNRRKKLGNKSSRSRRSSRSSRSSSYVLLDVICYT